MNAVDLGPLADPVDPVAARVMEERRELFRIAAKSALQNSENGKRLSPDARAWALHWSAIQPLGRPLSDGAPSPLGAQ